MKYINVIFLLGILIVVGKWAFSQSFSTFDSMIINTPSRYELWGFNWYGKKCVVSKARLIQIWSEGNYTDKTNLLDTLTKYQLITKHYYPNGEEGIMIMYWVNAYIHEEDEALNECLFDYLRNTVDVHKAVHLSTSLGIGLDKYSEQWKIAQFNPAQLIRLLEMMNWLCEADGYKINQVDGWEEIRNKVIRQLSPNTAETPNSFFLPDIQPEIIWLFTTCIKKYGISENEFQQYLRQPANYSLSVEQARSYYKLTTLLGFQYRKFSAYLKPYNIYFNGN